MKITKPVAMTILIERKHPEKCSGQCRYLEWGWKEGHYCVHYKKGIDAETMLRCRACVRDFGKGDAQE